MSSASLTRTETVPTARGFDCVRPIAFFLAVESGTRMTSSWSCPQADWPFGSRTPATVNGTFLIRMVWPTASVSPKRLRQTVSPRTATLLAASTSSGPNILPLAMVHSRDTR